MLPSESHIEIPGQLAELMQAIALYHPTHDLSAYDINYPRRRYYYPLVMYYEVYLT